MVRARRSFPLRIARRWRLGARTPPTRLPRSQRHRGARSRSGTRAAQERDLGLDACVRACAEINHFTPSRRRHVFGVEIDAQVRALLPDYPGGGKIQEASKRGQVPGPREQDPKSINRDEHAARRVPRAGVPRGGGRVGLIFESFHITPHSVPLARLEQTSCPVKSGVEEGKGDVMPCFREREV